MSDTVTRTATGFGARLVTPLVAGAVLNPINSTLIAVALIPIGQTFGAGPAATAWLLTSLYLATAVGQPVVGLFVDRFGARRVLLTGATIVMVAGVGGMLSLSLGWLIGVRVVLGIGTCAGFPAAMAVLRKRADATGQGVPSRVLSVLAMSAQTIMVIGPTLGGALIGIAGWPAIFAVNIPLAAASLVLALRWVPKDDRRRLDTAPIDVAGIVLFSVTLLVVLLFVMAPAVGDLPLLAVAAVLGAVFARTELRSAKPFIDLRMLAANAPLLRTYLRQALAFLIVYSIMFGYVQWLESARAMTEEHAGEMLLPMSAVAVIAAALSGKPTGIKIRLITNSLALLAGSAMLLVVGAGTGLVALVGVAAVFGLGQGLTSVTNQTALYSQAPAEQMGTASGLFRTAQYLGAIAASALIALCFGPHVTSAGLHRLAGTLVAAGVLLLTVTLADRRLGARTGSAAAAAVS
ncbi:MAG TPA: MFS transporter [Amycolatopsis sp.]|nr:MFS transporter [Amycolatopsis sp.]